MKSAIEFFPYVLLSIWTVFSVYYVNLARKEPTRINPYIFETIPQVFPTLGILGTFLGIAYGLFYFDVSHMKESIPELLNGLKTAFIASIFGILGLLVFSKWTAIVQRTNEKEKSVTSDELTALNAVVDQIQMGRKESGDSFRTLNNSLIGESDESLATQFAKVKNELSEQSSKLSKIQAALEIGRAHV